MVYEEYARSHAGCPNEVPGLASAVVPAPCAVTLVATEGGAEGICNLTNEYQSPGYAVGQLYHEVIEHQNVGKPHAGTEVVQNVPHAKCKPSWVRQPLRFITVRLVTVCVLLKVRLSCNSPLDRHPPRLSRAMSTYDVTSLWSTSKMADSQNKFTNDGSFLEQFKKLQEQKQAEKRKDNDSNSVQPFVKHLTPVVGRMGGQKRKLPLRKQSAKPVHKAFQEESDSDEDERNTTKERPEAVGPPNLQLEGQPCAESPSMACLSVVWYM